MTVAAPRTGAGTDRALARCTGDVERFLAEDWQRRAAVYRRTATAGFEDLLTLDDVDRFLTTTALRTPFFRLVRAGERIPEGSYTRSGRAGSRDVTGIADPARVAALFTGGATIVLQGLHRWSEPVMRFTRELELELGFPCQVNAYVTPAGAQGLDLHADPHDVFVLQAFGRKRWQVHAAPAEGEREPIDDEVAPGDTLYMPTGTPHAASAQAGVSGHLTVGVHVAAWRDVVGGVWSNVVADASLDEPLPPAWHRDPLSHAGALADRLRAAADRLAGVDGAEAMSRRADRFLTGRAQLARGSVAEAAMPVELGDDTVVRRRPGSICELRPSTDELVVLLGDRLVRMPAWVEPAMRVVAEAEGPLRVGDLADAMPDATSRSVLVRRMILEGLLTAAPDDGPPHEPR